MENALLRLALFAGQQLLLHSPELFARFQALISKPNVTIEDIQKLDAEIASASYSSIVTNTQIPPEQRTA